MTSERSLSVIGYACLVGKVIACPQVLQVVGGLGGPRDCAERKPWRKRLAPAIVIDVRVIFVMFSVEERERVRARLVQASREDDRLVAGALIGSTARGGGDQWSDLDLTFGLAVVYLLHARACIARGRMWEAEYSISAARDQTLALACLHHNLKTSYGRGFDDLPPETLKPFAQTLVGSLDKSQLQRALSTTIDELLHDSQDVSEMASRLDSQLQELKLELTP